MNMERWWNETDREISTYSVKICPTAIWSTRSSFSSSMCPVCLCGSPSLLSNGHRDSFLAREVRRAVMLNTHPHLVPRLRVNGAIPPLPPHEFMACTRTTSLPLQTISIMGQYHVATVVAAAVSSQLLSAMLHSCTLHFENFDPELDSKEAEGISRAAVCTYVLYLTLYTKITQRYVNRHWPCFIIKRDQ